MEFLDLVLDPGDSIVQSVPLHVIHLDQDDPKKCTSRKLPLRGADAMLRELQEQEKTKQTAAEKLKEGELVCPFGKASHR